MGKGEDIGQCYCGKTAKLVINPYYLDVDQIEVWDYLCDECYEMACDDI